MRDPRPFLLLLLLAAADLARPGTALAPAPAPADSDIALTGLERPVRIVTDRWGIPHLRAENLPDLYFAWGFVTARDRLWQLEHTRRAASGTLWEWFGNRTLTADGGAELFRLRERAERIWAREQADPAIRVPLERYAAGVNAYLARCRDGREPWPREFRRLGRRPADWRPEYAYLVMLAQAMLLDLDLPELDEAREIRERGLVWVTERQRYERDMAFASIPDSVAERLHGRPARPTLPGDPWSDGARTGALAPPPRPDPSVARARARLLDEARRTVAGWLSPATRPADERASNVFAVGAGRGANGAPLFANDPHLPLGTPSPLHAVHLSVPGTLEAAGAAVPGLPLIVSGRNQRCAWGLTALGADVMDVYADTLSRDGRSVRWHGVWTPMLEEPFAMRYRVLGLFPIPPPGRSRRYTAHGPVLALDRRLGMALSVRWAGDDDAVTFARLLGFERATRADQLAEAVRTQVTPTFNFVAADRDGRVVYQVAGALPRRGFDPPPGVLPGDGRREWQGLIPADSLPRWALGPEDFVVNGNNLPVGSPYPEPFPRYHFMQDRAIRMAQRLAGDRRMTLADMASVQNDVHSRGAARFLPLLLRCADSLADTRGRRFRAALDTLRAWDLHARRELVAPTLFRGWLGALLRRSRLEGTPMLAAAALDGRAPDALRTPGKETAERPAVAATAALEMALGELEEHLGRDLARWTWGRAHGGRFRHALAWKDARLSPAPWPADGDQSTVSVGRSSLPWSTVFTHGPVWRHVVDLAVAESSLCVLPPGNAGAGPHARDHLARWARHGYVPLHLDWDRVAAAAGRETRLRPAAGGAAAGNAR
jgi:penicillin amidase